MKRGTAALYESAAATLLSREGFVRHADRYDGVGCVVTVHDSALAALLVDVRRVLSDSADATVRRRTLD